MIRKDPENWWCSGCGFCCTKILGRTSRLLQDDQGHLFVVEGNIEECKVSDLIREGISKESARSIITKGERLI